MTVSPTPLSRQLSDAIRVARVVALFFMSFTHVRPGAEVLLADAWDGALDVTETFLLNVLGRGAVPLLSIVSGVLAWRSLCVKAPSRFAVEKFRTLIVPMIFWNCVMLALLLLFYLLARSVDSLPTGWLKMLPDSPTALMNAIFSLTSQPINAPLAFLRDLFTCAILAAPIRYALMRSTELGLIAIAALLGFVFLTETWLILRDQILLFFCLGLLIARFGLEQRRLDVSVLTVAFAATTAVNLLIDGGVLAIPGYSLSVLNRLIVSLTLWALCLRIAASALFPTVARLEKFMFIFFCTHWILFFVLGFALWLTPMQRGSEVFEFAVLAEPLLGLAFAAFVSWGLDALRAGWLDVLTGRRDATRPATTR